MRFDARAFLADPHAELDRVTAEAVREVERQVDPATLTPAQVKAAAEVNRARAAELREELRKHAIREARRRGRLLPANFGAVPAVDLAAVKPEGRA